MGVWRLRPRVSNSLPPPHREIHIFKSGKTVLDESGVVIHKNWYEILPATWLICPGMQVSTLVKKKKVEGCVPICREYRSYQGSRVTTGKKKKRISSQTR